MPDRHLALIKKMSPAAWRHIHLNGHSTFRTDGQGIDLDAILAGLEVGDGILWVWACIPNTKHAPH